MSNFALATAPPPLSSSPDICFVGATHPGRDGVERFIELRFREAYGAELRSHYPLLAALNGPDGAPRAAAGLRFAEDEPLFLERYLDKPVEDEVARALSLDLDRRSVVEIGSLASVSPPATLQLFAALAIGLSQDFGRHVAVATVRPDLAELLSRAGFGLRRLAAADPARIAGSGHEWGTYYADAPQVFAAEIRRPTGLEAIFARNILASRQPERRRAAS